MMVVFRILLPLAVVVLNCYGAAYAAREVLVGGEDPQIQANRVYVYVSTEEGGTFYCDGIQPRCGGTPPLFGSMEGILAATDPIDACEPLNTTSVGETTFAIIKRGGCNTTVKAINVQAAGYVAAIVYDDKMEELVAMWEDLNWPGNGIPIVFVSYTSGQSVLALLQQAGPTCSISDTWAPLRKVVLIVVAWLFMQVVVNVWNGLLPGTNPRPDHSLLPERLPLRPRWDPKSLPVFLYESSKDESVSEDARICTICIQEFEEGEPVRLLPCQHGFHTECIDPWFGRDRILCPMCKQPANRAIPDSPRSEDGHFLDPAPWSPIHPSSPRSQSGRYDPFASNSPTPHMTGPRRDTAFASSSPSISSQ